MFADSKANQEAQVEALGIIRDAYDKLMGRQFFYFNIASQFALKAVSAEQCPTMGVANIDGVMWLVYNPDFIKYYNYDEISVILEHEICHFTYDHVQHFDSSTNASQIFKNEEEAADSIRQKKEDAYIAKTKNICTDRSINNYLFALANIRMSLADIKRDFTDPEGKFHQDKMDEHMAKVIKKGDMWFKDSAENISNMTDETILECSCITEESFKKILVKEINLLNL